ncbi:germinal-center associated nuclear protein-like [Lithobates pipiens]
MGMEVRRRALQVMNIAYTSSPQRPTLFPLEKVVCLLLFQDADQAAEFLTAYGLSMSDGNQRILMILSNRLLKMNYLLPQALRTTLRVCIMRIQMMRRVMHHL